jgi:phage terminase small subunit
MGQEVANTTRNGAGRITGSRGLTTLQAKYVKNYIRNGGDETAAAQAAGCANPYKDGWALARLAPVIAAIKKQHDKRICGPLASLALGVIHNILSTPPADKDSKALQARVALKVVERARLGAAEEDLAQADKALGAMSVSELEAFVASYKDQEARTIDVTPCDD